MSTFFAGGLHFGNKEIFELYKRPFINMGAYHDTVITNWNKVVKEDDNVFVLGGFGCISYMKQLNGKFFLMLTSSDIKGITNKEMLYSTVNEMFETVNKGVKDSKLVEVYLEPEVIDIAGTLVHVCQEPSDANPVDFNIVSSYTGFRVDDNTVNVLIDLNHYVPFSYTSIEDLRNKLEDGVFRNDIVKSYAAEANRADNSADDDTWF